MSESNSINHEGAILSTEPQLMNIQCSGNIIKEEEPAGIFG